MSKCNLFDIINHKHDTPPATHVKGNRLDIILGTCFILENTNLVGNLALTEGASSNHVACFLDLDKRIFHKNTDPLKNTSRGFTSRQHKKFLQYGAQVDDILCHHKSLNYLLEQLESPNSTMSKEMIANNIDKIITDTMLQEENKFCSCRKNIAWSLIY